MYDYNNECDCDYGTVPFWFIDETPSFFKQLIPQEERNECVDWGKEPEYDLTGRFAIKMMGIISDKMFSVSKWTDEYDKLRDLHEYYSDRMLAHSK